MENNDEKQENYLTSKKLLQKGIWSFIICIVLIIFMPLLITKCSLIPLDVSKPNEIGDTIGGILGPSVGIIAAALTFLAFWAQYDTNITQRKQFNDTINEEKFRNKIENDRVSKEIENQIEEAKNRNKQFELNKKLQEEQIVLQDIAAKTNIFETRFNTMLSIQRDNANGIEVNNIKGRKVFLHMLDELKYLFEIFSEINKEKLCSDKEIDKDILYNIAYLSFFFGIGEKSTKLVKNLVPNDYIEFVERSHLFIIKCNNNSFQNMHYIKVGKTTVKAEITYTLGTGHLRRLSHYIRHLFQIVKFVDEQNDKIISDEKKYNYLSNLRAQLTVHEQLLLFYNAISILGKPWIDKNKKDGQNYIERYCLLKSIPLTGYDFYNPPSDYFQNENNANKSMFEWHEIQKRMTDLVNSKS